ncbi:hypothetical protein [Planctomicrobium piriforme]|nr:hypothetical protein [Planctomicrobium piriforme]
MPAKRPPVAAAEVVTAKEEGEAEASTLDLSDYPFLQRTFWVKFWERLNGEDGAAYLLSFVFHLVLLAVLAIPVIQSMQREAEVTTIISGDGNEAELGTIGDPINTGLDLATIEPVVGDDMGKPVLDNIQAEIASTTDINPDEMLALKGAAAATAPGAGQGEPGAGGGKKGTNGTGNSPRVAEPGNAIRAGSFSVWPWPIAGKDVKGNILHGDPGSPPRVFQDYHIVIRLKVPRERKSVNLSDFSGDVLGTDKYYQKIPQDAWFFTTGGELVRARTGKAIPVVDGTAELLIRVPGAGSPRVRDTITVYSRVIDEEQKIELVFIAGEEAADKF